MTHPNRTVFHDRHGQLGARFMDFGGWEMPLQYPTGVVQEHLATRNHAGLFDVSHMGRFWISGPGRVAFLQHVLTNNAEALDGRPTGAQYTVIPTEAGGAMDDAYLYRFDEERHLLVVNASNRTKDLEHLRSHLGSFPHVELRDVTEELVMLAVQGPAARGLLSDLVEEGRLPEPIRNAVAEVRIAGAGVLAGRTGYTGEPVGLELFLDRDDGPRLWDLLVERGATPCGLGA
ncbi:MAG TPA: glycine cleavage system protein T, partial [Actinomycetota bacterium]|nr:glycine cleavage system protein T [Actinomycetota bacterium]